MFHTSPGRAELSALDRQARLFQAMASPIRIAILRLVANRDLSVNEIVEGLGAYASLGSVERTNVSKHLAVLREEGIVAVAGDSRRRLYRMVQSCLVEALDCVLAGACCPPPRRRRATPDKPAAVQSRRGGICHD